LRRVISFSISRRSQSVFRSKTQTPRKWKASPNTPAEDGPDKPGITGADSLVVEYDATYGYPKSISIDPIKTDIDEEIAYFVEAFIPSK
jgi:hypothetical protein